MQTCTKKSARSKSVKLKPAVHGQYNSVINCANSCVFYCLIKLFLEVISAVCCMDCVHSMIELKKMGKKIKNSKQKTIF